MTTHSRDQAVPSGAGLADELADALAEADGAEINPSNYGHDDVCLLNDRYVALFEIAERAITALRQTPTGSPDVRDGFETFRRGWECGQFAKGRKGPGDVIDFWFSDEQADLRTALSTPAPAQGAVERDGPTDV